MYNTNVNNNDLTNQSVNVIKDAHQVSDMLELFAEELPEHHDHAVPISTGGTVSTIGSTVSTVGTVSSLF